MKTASACRYFLSCCLAQILKHYRRLRPAKGSLDEGFVGVVKNQPEFIKNFAIPGTTASIEPSGQIDAFSSVLRT
ncbi:MAG: hypothetical protein DIZ78_06000 [endosymbiont of Escarpia spicata]|uniref:Uncharacterized protein n=1 Tax=endosymbiont of Escarpia spicata TaxID=2200908 RepID=A0A370DQ22_9GAMM|nr:MAG: hypothetical protein DIZ78_06000 [endosymbiont of Escarpia spicata]